MGNRSSSSLYEVKLDALGNSGVSGSVLVYQATDQALAYWGTAKGLEINLLAPNCTATNACGSHVHAGFSCANTTSQGGHYYIGATDPWLTEIYTSDAMGQGSFGGVVDMGGSIADLEGRAFVVHSSSGSRIGCGLLEKVEKSSKKKVKVFEAVTLPFGGSGVYGKVLAATGLTKGGEICYVGHATGLEPYMVSFLRGGNDCLATNGCGTHVHAGLGCGSVQDQLGHYYDSDVVSVDPWLWAGYLSTSADGQAWFGNCIQTGYDNPKDYEDRVFIIHNNAGGRVSCGPLEYFEKNKGSTKASKASSTKATNRKAPESSKATKSPEAS